MSNKNQFDTLGVKPGASLDEIKKSYRSLAKQWHPDKNDASGAEEKFKEISAAYEFLKNDDRREILERDLKKPKPAPTNTTTSSPGGYYQPGNKTSDTSSSGTSYKFGEESSNNRYYKSSFGFAGEGYSSFKPDNKTGKKKSKRKPGEKKKPSSAGWKPWNSDWNMDDDDLFYDIPESADTSPPNFSFAFKSFVDDLGMNFDAFFTDPTQNSWEFPSFYDNSDPFAEFFQRPGSFSTFGSTTNGVPPHRQRTRHVAPEDENVGLDEEYFFSPPPRTRPQSSYSNKSFFADEDTASYRQDTTSDFDDGFDSSLFKCTYCGKRMPFDKLSSHEPGCSLRKAGRFKEPEEESVNGEDEDQYPQNTGGDWRDTHQELLNNIRRAKKAANHAKRMNAAREMSAHSARTAAPSPSPTKDDGVAQVRCKWCERKFSHPAAKHHIPFCEKWTKEHGTPLNPARPQATRDAGSKSHRAKEYAKHIPKPGGCAEDDANSPRSPRTHFPDIGVGKRETMHRPGAPSGTGLHASTSYTPRARVNTKTTRSTGIGSKHAKSKFGNFTDNSDFAKASPVDDSYGFGISGAKLNGEQRSSRLPDRCSICKKVRLSCTCGVRRTGS